MKSVFISHSLKLPAQELADVLSAELSQAGYRVLRYSGSISDNEPGFQEYIRRADMIVGIVLDDNPNVFFEIGYASGVGKRVVLVTFTDVNLPADVKAFQCIEGGSSVSQTALAVTAEVDEIIRQRTPVAREYTSYRDKLETYRTDPVYFETLDNKAFTQCLFELFQDVGFRPQVLDQEEYIGIDFVLDHFENFSRTMVDIKKYNKNSMVSVGKVQQLFGAISAFHADHGIIVTTSSFTRSAQDFASKRTPKIELWDMEKILDMI